MSPDEHDEYFVVDLSDMVVVYAGTARCCQQVVDESFSRLSILSVEERLCYGDDLKDV